MYKYIKTSTDNIPLMDDVVFYLKKMCTESVIKLQNLADINETALTAHDAYRYLCAVDDSAQFSLYEYTFNELLDAGVPNDIIHEAYVDTSLVPTFAREILLRNKKEDIINTYREGNDYYKMLNGQPRNENEFIYLTEDWVPPELTLSNIGTPIHNYSDEECDLLYHYGIIDNLKREYPYCTYLDYLGSKKISIYTARKAGNFNLLYVPHDVPIELMERFKDRLALNRVYIENVVHSDAYRFKSDNYDNFLAVLLMILTTIDIVSEIPDMINKYEIFDLKMVKLIFDNYDIDYFDEIPFHYQLSMIKNLHKLLKYKSTTLNVVDICSLFGFDNVRVFKYYLLKERKMRDGKYVFKYDPDTYELDTDASYDLKFIKVPIKETVSKYLNKPSHIIEYDQMVKKDPLWNGGLNHEYVKSEIMKLQFNHYYTKYMSVDVLNAISTMAFQMCYFHNILFDDHYVEDRLLINLNNVYPSASRKFRLVDVLCFLYALGYRYRGYKDNIISKQSKIMYVMGFNFEADLDLLASKVSQNGYTFKDLGIDNWVNPNEILTVNQLVEVYTNNKKIHDHLIYCMNHAENKREFDVYKMVYEALMITKFTNKIFTLPDGTIAETYTDYIRSRDAILFKLLLDVDAIDDVNERNNKISKLINDAVLQLSEYIEGEELDHVFNIFPTVSKDAIRDYVRSVIMFFKSYKVDLEAVNSILTFDDAWSNKIRVLDDMDFIKTLTFDSSHGNGHIGGQYEIINVIDKILNEVSVKWKDSIDINDYATIMSIVIRDVFMRDDIVAKDRLSNLLNTLSTCDTIHIDNEVLRQIELSFKSEFDIYDIMHVSTSYGFIESIEVNEHVAIMKINIKDIFLDENITVNSHMENEASLIYTDYMVMTDKCDIKNI